ncbi:DUF3995 domain-containing protein [Aureibaculum sp. A20]|uniref:DUF3995 domain-containing protein n=1 Tax=Aureibaculum flavum TaxID=2795986 RepID=A0ABS0WP96_9FLAO|nr:DUF3995 domain-containing protein [Aureibaculum flavum]MBJ2173783.1 DUF3995 domain-containing protein [Aureibaculum flavum]
MILTLILSSVFFILALIHFNWVVGGSFGFAASLPTTVTGERMLNPKKMDSAIVGLGLTAFGLFYLIKADLIDIPLPLWIFTVGSWLIPAIFLIRAIGEFKYVGFFKRIKTTDFARLDSKLFSPLCLIIAVLGVLIHVLN